MVVCAVVSFVFVPLPLVDEMNLMLGFVFSNLPNTSFPCSKQLVRVLLGMARLSLFPLLQPRAPGIQMG